MTHQDPHLAAAKQAVTRFHLKSLTAEAALSQIWETMQIATAEGWPAGPYVTLSDQVSFPQEPRDLEIEALWAEAQGDD